MKFFLMAIGLVFVTSIALSADKNVKDAKFTGKVTRHIASVGESICYELSKSENAWSKTPEMMCVSQVSTSDYAISFRINEMGKLREIGHFNMNLLQRARCMDCNEDHFGISNPSNSVFNNFGVQFHGKVFMVTVPEDHRGFTESGTVSVGSISFVYRSMK